MILLWFHVARADPSYCEASKALYAWNCTTERNRDGQPGWWHLLHDTNGCGQRLVDFAVSHRITRVYLYVGAVQWDWASSFSQGVLPEEDALVDLGTRLRAAGIEPWALWYLNDDPDDLQHVERVTDLVASVAAFGAAHPDAAFAGLHGDQEPNDRDTYPQYLELNRIGNDAVADPLGASGALGWGASLKPAWLGTPYDGAPMFHAVLDRVTVGTLMDYSDDPERVRAQAETFLGHADTRPVRAEIAVETGTTDPTPGVSFSELVRTDPDAFLTLMGALDTEFGAHPSYDGLVLHDFTQYFAGLYGVEPYDFVGEVPVLCPPVGTTPTDTDAPPDTAVPAGGGDGPPEPERGCGCGHPGASPGWLAVFGLRALRRRRAHQARRGWWR